MTTLIACSHGTGSAEGRHTVERIIESVRRAAPGTRVVPAFVDVQEPRIGDVVAAEAALDDVVVVPLLLSAGYHTRIDIAQAVARHPRARQGAPLGTHPLIAQVLATRLRAAIGGAWRDDDHVVLAAAGSSDAVAAEDVRSAAEQLAALIPAPVSIGYASAIEPRIPEAVESARTLTRGRVIAASHVLAPGYFAGLVSAAGADVVSAPLGADPRVADVVLDRFAAV